MSGLENTQQFGFHPQQDDDYALGETKPEELDSSDTQVDDYALGGIKPEEPDSFDTQDDDDALGELKAEEPHSSDTRDDDYALGETKPEEPHSSDTRDHHPHIHPSLLGETLPVDSTSHPRQDDDYASREIKSEELGSFDTQENHPPIHPSPLGESILVGSISHPTQDDGYVSGDIKPEEPVSSDSEEHHPHIHPSLLGETLPVDFTSHPIQDDGSVLFASGERQSVEPVATQSDQYPPSDTLADPGLVVSTATDRPNRVPIRYYLTTALAGLLVGIETNIAGGVLTSTRFLHLYSPKLMEEKILVQVDNYCKYDHIELEIFNMSLFLSAALGVLAAFMLSSSFKHLLVLRAACFLHIAGVAFSLFSSPRALFFIIGRLARGAAIGIISQVIQTYYWEICPSNKRYRMDLTYNLVASSGLPFAALINMLSSLYIPSMAWRVALGSTIVLSPSLLVLTLVIQESPYTLVEKGKEETATNIMRRFWKEEEDLGAELRRITIDLEQRNGTIGSIRHLIEEESRHKVVIAAFRALSLPLTGYTLLSQWNGVVLYSFGYTTAAIFGGLLIGCWHLLWTCLFPWIRYQQKKKLYLVSCFMMIVSQVAISMVLFFLGDTKELLEPQYASLIIIFLGLFMVGNVFLSSSINWVKVAFPNRCMIAGFAMTGIIGFIVQAGALKISLALLCVLKWGTFATSAAIVVFIGIFILYVVPPSTNNRDESQQEGRGPESDQP